MSALLEVENLTVSVPSNRGETTLVSGVSVSVDAGATLGLVGESGSGKSVTVLSILRLLAAAKTTGSVRLEGRDLLSLSEGEMRKIRGRQVSMIFQDPAAALNPALRIGEQITEPLRVHEKQSRALRYTRAVELLRTVGIPAPELRVDAYPHQLSGGQRQRAMIAMAIASSPSLLIADEPTTALDVTVQAQIIDLLRALQKTRGMTLILVSHDLGLVAETCDQVAVLYAGQVVEKGPTARVFAAPRHPYTRALVASTPSLGAWSTSDATEVSPTLLGISDQGCRFRSRCKIAQPDCATHPPPWVEGSDGGHRCLFPLQGGQS